MLLTMEELVKVLRDSVNVQQEESEVIDPAYLSMSDEDLILYIKLAISRAYPDVMYLSELPEGSEYPVMLLAQISLYTKLAVARVDKVDMGADNNNYLKQSQRFKHYMDLVQSAKNQYESWSDKEGQSGLESYDVFLDKNHYSRRNYELQIRPKVYLTIDEVTTDSVSFHWINRNSEHFARFKAYISKSHIFDIFRDGASYRDKLTGNETEILSTSDFRNTYKLISGLTPNTRYYLAVVTVERNQLWGYDETTIETLPVIDTEDDFSIDTLPPDEGGEVSNG